MQISLIMNSDNYFNDRLYRENVMSDCTCRRDEYGKNKIGVLVIDSEGVRVKCLVFCSLNPRYNSVLVL